MRGLTVISRILWWELRFSLPAGVRNYLFGRKAGWNRYRDWKEFRESVDGEVHEFLRSRGKD